MKMAWQYQSGATVADTASTSLVDAVQEQMPGWTIASTSSAANTDALDAIKDSAETQPGPNIEALRRKFLGSTSDETSDASTLPRDQGGAVRSGVSVEVFKVEPIGGGPSQVAERRNGKVRVVSG